MRLKIAANQKDKNNKLNYSQWNASVDVVVSRPVFLKGKLAEYSAGGIRIVLIEGASPHPIALDVLFNDIGNAFPIRDKFATLFTQKFGAMNDKFSNSNSFGSRHVPDRLAFDATFDEHQLPFSALARLSHQA